MKSKPKGAKYRNLHARGGVIYYEREIAGRRIKLSTKTSDWDVAASFRDLYEQRKGIGRIPLPLLDVPRFEDVAKRYLEEDTGQLEWTTRAGREGHLAPAGPLVSYFGRRRLDEITPALLRVWWGQEIERPRVRPGTDEPRALSAKTGRNYLDDLAVVFRFAQDVGLVDSSPVPAFREVLRRRSRTKQARAEAETKIDPLERPEELSRLVASARDEGLVAYVLVLLCLDAGLRLGEALGLRWGDVRWGAGDDDRGRALAIEQNRPRGGSPTRPKSGRTRVVALSLRLRSALLELAEERFFPSPAALVLDAVEPNNFRHRTWRRICARAELGHRRIKDLRDSYASHLLTAGVQLGWISKQLGHSNVHTTAQHYARWCGGDEYREPLALRVGELPPDLLARIAPAESHQSPTTRAALRSAAVGRGKRKPSESEDFRGL